MGRPKGSKNKSDSISLNAKAVSNEVSIQLPRKIGNQDTVVALAQLTTSKDPNHVTLAQMLLTRYCAAISTSSPQVQQTLAA